MLTNLSVRDFALFEKFSVDFQAGFNVLTGETGAGKSILIDAFNIALGGKASADYIRSGADFFVVQAVFDIAGNLAVRDMLDELALDYEQDELILSRKVSAAGKNACTVNGIRTPVSVLRALGEKLVDVHGQYENQQLLKADTYLGLIDSYLPEKDALIIPEYRHVFAELKSAVRQIRDNEQSAVERERTLDILTWEIEEIEKAALKVGEDKELEERSKKLANAEKISSALSLVYGILDGEGSKYGSMLAAVADASRQMSFAAGFDRAFESAAAKLQEMEYELAELKIFLASRLEDAPTQGESLEAVEQRLDVIYRLKKKYGEEIEAVLSYGEQAKERRDALLRVEESGEQLERQKAVLLKKAKELAGRLTALREENAAVFVKNVLSHIHDLAMPQAEFFVEVKPKDKLSESGLDEISFLFCANAGQQPRALNKVASGGELSRIALAIKTVLLGREGLPTMVFDEVDTGVGGVTAQRMAEKLAAIALKKQVLCITHLPQIACMADCHIQIEKKQELSSTRIEVKTLDEKGRVDELTRMIAGDDNTKLARENAQQMIDRAEERKKLIFTQSQDG